jgi:ABC-type transporter Mla subunit MlaD
MLHEVGNLVKALRTAADSMAQTQIDYAEMGRNLNTITAAYTERMARLSSDIGEIKQLLKHGFRLPE